MVGLMPQLPQQERLMSPFFTTRNTGIMLSGTLANERMTWAGGAFNDWIETGEKLNSNATNWVGRISGLVTVSEDNLNYFHLGVGGRFAGSDNGTMRFSGRPSSNVADKYVDTKSFPAENATEMSLEAIYSFAPVHVAGRIYQNMGQCTGKWRSRILRCVRFCIMGDHR